MPLHASKTVVVAITCPLERAYVFLSKPDNFPQWAAGLGSGITRRDNQWIAQTPIGEAVIEFTDPNPFGVLDHTVHLPDGTRVHVPMRVVANGDGCEVSLTLFREEDWSDQRFEGDIELVKRDLDTLKTVLES